MMRRTSVLLDNAAYERLKQRARRRGTTVSEEVREAVEGLLEEEPNPNQGLLDLADEFARLAEWKPGPFPPVDSDEAMDQMMRDRYRQKFNREPDW